MLLVLAVLTGVLGMHALPPGGAPMAHAEVMAHQPSGDSPTVHCTHDGGGSDHLEHADGTCAAAGIGSPYAPPAPATGALDPVNPATVATSAFTPAERDRAPPDLSELQLLRI